ncbi:MAG: septal ring lytic transglycosylase RlpA family protein, partial [Gammaproteobacteria bacterium]
MHKSSDGPPPVTQQTEISNSADAVPRQEPRSKYGNPPSYVVFGKTYYTLPSSEGYVQRGIASWYGKKFHGRRTSSGETYDMYGMTAAHTQLPLPTYVQVTNLKNNKQVILRVNDRGPFHGNRIIDLSYTAATRLDIVKEGTGLVEVRALNPRNYQPEQNKAAGVNRAKQEKAVMRSGSVNEHSTAALVEASTISNFTPQVFVQVGAFSEHEN